MNHRDSGLSQQTDVFEEYEERKDNLLDHLVPAQHRSGQPTEVPIRVHNSNDSSLRSMQTACEAAEESYNNRKQWSPEVLNGFNSAFATVIKVPVICCALVCHQCRMASCSCTSPLHKST